MGAFRMSINPHGPIPPLPPIEASPEMMAEARQNCADRLRARSHFTEADAFDAGLRDDSWSLRHEINRLKAESAE